MYPASNLLKLTSISEISSRYLGKNVYKWAEDGVQYPGFKYYPRKSTVDDPPYAPSKLFRVQRIKPMKGAPYWEKNILKELKLDGKQSEIAIVKNIPENNSRLWRIKHLIKITPITFPNGLPHDSKGTYLKENGELVVFKKLDVDSERSLATKNFENDPKRLKGDVLRRELRKKWLSGW